MFASSSKTKNIIVRNSMTHRPTSAITTTTTTTALAQRSASRVNSIAGETRIVGSLSRPQMRSRFTERKPTPLSATASGRVHSSQIQSGLIKAQASTITAHGDGRKVIRGIPSNTAARATARQWQKREAAAIVAKLAEGPSKKTEHMEQLNHADIGIQTNEPEILNHDLIIGDIKLLHPTASVMADIEQQRTEARKKLLLKAQRKFEGHSEKQEAHLTDLKEFLEKSAVTRRSRKPKLNIEVDKKLISSMDEILNKGVPKTESITDIKGRIKKKEQELLTLFDTVENLKI
ncbi:uncharacterized protein LOC129245667 [Anastrepha obliqua]|uniref:uncharacterized protein LOC129245667 n=1 Tax=Anastrepha obliqua TaxID=95512 RepID=UPI00240956B8|nr:uncharacterized protein LOC129245667 [Anastrepha obliqua]